MSQIGIELGLTDAQLSALHAEGMALVAACAGSGKTKTLAAMIVRAIKELNYEPHQVMATSFSKKSALELISRIINYGGVDILKDAPKENFGTTHSIAYAILRQFPTELGELRGIQGDYKIRNDGQDRMIVKMALGQVKMRSNKAIAVPNPKGLFDFSSVTYSNQCGFSAVPAASLPGNTVAPVSEYDYSRAMSEAFGLATWGYQKGFSWADALYRVLINYMSSATLRPSQPLSSLDSRQVSELNVVFQNKTVKSKLEKIGISTPFYLPTPLQTKVYSNLANINPEDNAVIKADHWNLCANQWFNIGADPNQMVDKKGKPLSTGYYSKQIDLLRSYAISPTEAYHNAQTVEDRITACIYAAYTWLKNHDATYAYTINFDDMLEYSVALLSKYETIREAYQNKLKFILVDEAQDLNQIQHYLFGLLAGYLNSNTLTPREFMTADTFCFIGDADQAIYEFRGALPQLFTVKSNLIKDLPNEGFKTYLLDTNFRSGSNIVNAAQRLISHNKDRIPLTSNPYVKNGAGLIRAICFDVDTDIVKYVSERVLSRDNLSYKDFGIGVRTNTEAFMFGLDFLKRGIPFRSKLNFFNDPTTKALLYWLTAANTQASTEEINECVLNAFSVPRFNLNDTFITHLKGLPKQNYLTYLQKGGWSKVYTEAWRNEKYVKPYMEALTLVQGWSNLPPAEVLQNILNIKGAVIAGSSLSIVESLIEKVKEDPNSMETLRMECGSSEVDESYIKDFALAPIAPLMGLIENHPSLQDAISYIHQLQEANSKYASEDGASVDAVMIDTCHGWKGLEVHTMFVPMASNKFPHSLAPIESERRLAYVALTRGRQEVTVLYPRFVAINSPAGKVTVSGISSFVLESEIPIENDSAHSEGEL